MEIPKDLLYTEEHEWIRVKGSRGVIGVTKFAQEQLGDVVFVELPQTSTHITQGNTFGVVESVKAVSDCYAPVSGRLAEFGKPASRIGLSRPRFRSTPTAGDVRTCCA